MEIQKLLKSKQFIIPILLFLLAFTPRLYYMNEGLFHTDSVFQAMALEKTVKEGEFTYMHPPGYAGQVVVGSLIFFIHRLFTGAESAEFAATFTSLLTGSLATVVMYLFVEQISKSKITGMYAAVLLSFLPVFFSVTTYAKSHGTEILFMLLTVYFAYRSGTSHSDKDKLFTGICLGFAASVRVTSWLLTPILFLLYWINKKPFFFEKSGDESKLMLRQKPENILKDMGLIVIPAIVFFVIPNIPLFMREGIVPFTTISEYAGFLGLFSPLLSMSISWMGFSFTKIGWILLAIGIIYSFKKDKYLSGTLIIWSLLFLFYLGNLTVTTPRYLLPVMMPLIVFIAFGLKGLGTFISKKIQGVEWAPSIILLIMVYIMFMSIHPLVDFRKDYSGPKQFSLKIAETTEDNAIIIGMDENQHYKYYAHREFMGHPISADTKEIYGNPRDGLLKIKEILEKGTPVYITYPQGLGYAPPVPLKYTSNGSLVNGVDGLIYENIGFNARSQMFFDKTTLTTLPISIQSPGAYPLALFNEFKLTQVAVAENEDWHRKSIQSGRVTGIIYKIELRQ